MLRSPFFKSDISLIIFIFFYEVPSQQKRLETPNKGDVKTEYIKTQEEKTNIVKPSYIPLSMVLKSTSVDRINFENQKIKGSINAIGLKIDNLELKIIKRKMVVQTFYTLRKQKILISCNSALIQLIEALFYQIQKQNGVYLKIAIKQLQSGKTHKIFLLK